MKSDASRGLILFEHGYDGLAPIEHARLIDMAAFALNTPCVHMLASWTMTPSRTPTTALPADHSAWRIPDDTIERGTAGPEDPDRALDVILVATGSEVHLTLDAAAALGDESVATCAVLMTSMERFEDQSESYRRDVLPPDVPTVAIS